MTSASSVPLCLENWASPLKKATSASQRTVGSENLQFISAPSLIFFGVNSPGLPRKSYSSESLSFPNASIGGSTGLTTDETVTRALMKTFGGDSVRCGEIHSTDRNPQRRFGRRPSHHEEELSRKNFYPQSAAVILDSPFPGRSARRRDEKECRAAPPGHRRKAAPRSPACSCPWESNPCALRSLGKARKPPRPACPRERSWASR